MMGKVLATCFITINFLFSVCQLGKTQVFEESNTFDNAETFEDGVPTAWLATDGGGIQVSTRRYKQGTHSLKWDWTENSKIVVNDPALRTVSTESNSGLKIWIYSESNIGESVSFKFYDGSKRLRCTFDYEINFIGWRGLWVRFWDDIAVSGNQINLESMEIVAPRNINTGTLFFDIVEFASSISYKRSPSYQYAHPYPYTDNEEVKDEWASWIYEQRYPNPTFPLQTKVTPEQKQALANITKRFDEWLLGNDSYSGNIHMDTRLSSRANYIANGVNLFSQLGVSKDDEGVIHGPGLFASKSSHRPKFGRDVGEDLCLQLALDYRLNGSEASRDKLLLIYDYMYDQGHAAGSAMETTDHQKLRTAAWAYSVYLMKDVLKQRAWKNGKTLLDRERETQHWLNYFNIIFAPLDDVLEVSVDDFRSNTLMRLMYILMMDNDDPVKVQYMQHYTQWVNRNLRTFEGWTGGIKPDGMGYHHRGPYMNAYSNNGVHIMSQVLYFLRHTIFDADAEAKETVKKYLLNYRIITKQYDVPKGVCGRISGLEKAVGMISPMAYLSQCMRPDETDAELAAAMMALWNPDDQPVKDMIRSASMSISYFRTPGEIAAILDVESKNIQAENQPTGFWIKPYAAMAVFRGADWFVSVKGSSAYVFDYESGSSENTYGRYDGLGQMEIVANLAPYPSMIHSGHDYNNGWDWCRVPGTTAINEELWQLQSSTQRIFTPNTFVGGVQHNNKSGVWAMEYQDVHYHKGLQFKKSIFFFEPNLMVCLGSDITSFKQNDTQTSILQNVLSSSNADFWVNGAKVESNEYVYTPLNSSATIINSFGQGVYIPNDTHLNIKRGLQESETMRKKASSGDVITSWFKHSSDRNYEYAILMNASQNQLDAMKSQPRYDVIRKDAKAHIVHISESKQTGYALFDTNVELFDGLIISSSLPVMAMNTELPDGKQMLSICNPDFNRNKYDGIGDVDTFDDLFGPFDSQLVQLKLRGLWLEDNLPSNVSIISKNINSTVFEIETHDAKSYEFTLTPDTSTVIGGGDNDEFFLWPNPTRGRVNFTKADSACLYNVTGQSLCVEYDTDYMDLTMFSSGYYILELSIGKEKVRSKVYKID